MAHRSTAVVRFGANRPSTKAMEDTPTFHPPSVNMSRTDHQLPSFMCGLRKRQHNASSISYFIPTDANVQKMSRQMARLLRRAPTPPLINKYGYCTAKPKSCRTAAVTHDVRISSSDSISQTWFSSKCTTTGTIFKVVLWHRCSVLLQFDAGG
jgi:hypothetical protein